MTTLLRRLRRPTMFIFVLLAIEFLDEFVFGARETAWPMIRTDLHLNYEQIGLLLSIPAFIASLIEPALGILGDVWKRRIIVLGGGVIFMLSLVLTALSQHWAVLLLSFILFYPASGAFVHLSQSTLMDSDPARHEQNMARWTFAGSLGVVGGSFVLIAVTAVGGDWRSLFALSALLTLFCLMLAWRFPFTNQPDAVAITPTEFVKGIRMALSALRRQEVIRWLVLLQFSDLMLDVLYGYIALYFVDVVRLSEEQAGLIVAIWLGISLLGDLLLIPLLERVQGLSYLRISTVLEFVLFPAFLLVPGVIPKLFLLSLIGLFSSGWYPILAGQLYSAMPGQSGIVMTVGNISGLVGSLIPFVIGLAAEHFGLGTAIWLLLLGPIALIVGLPRQHDNAG